MNKSNQEPKIVLITGGSRGIGKSIALNAAHRGLGVIFTYNSQQEQANAVVKEITENGGKAVALRLDVGNMNAIAGFSTTVKEALKQNWERDRIDFLVNNAGIGQRSLIKDVTEDVFDELVNINFKGVFFLTQALLPLLNDGGQIINISSALSRLAFPGTSVYGSLKAAVEGLTRYFAKEYADRKIRVNTVAPGAIDTEFGGGKGDEEHRRQIAASIALGRIGEANDIGVLVASLLSEDSRYVNAQRIEAAGGLML